MAQHFDITVQKRDGESSIELWQEDGDRDDLVLIFSEEQAKAVIAAIQAQAKELGWSI